MTDARPAPRLTHRTTLPTPPLLDALPTLANLFTALGRVTWWRFAIEFVIIGAVVYWVIRFLQGTRGARVFKGIVVVLITLGLGARILGELLDLARLGVLFNQFLFYASFAILIVFQPELRRALMRLGETRLFRGRATIVDEISEFAEAAATLSRRRVGALVAFERDTGLSGFAEEATRIDAVVSAALLTTIFHPNTSLHDLGVVIRNGRIAYAGVQFPLAESGDLPKELGSRHRAAVGLSVETDAVVVIVSEETGDISIAERGKLHRKLGVERMTEMLGELMHQSIPVDVRAQAEGEEKKPARRAKAKGEKTSEKTGETGGDAASPAPTKPAPKPTLKPAAKPASPEKAAGSDAADDKPVDKPVEDKKPAPIREVKPVGA